MRHFRGLDGIRAIAVAAVLCYHFDVPHAAGGFLGVDLFFVLSGYLITSQLVTRWLYGPTVTTGSFVKFWAARARRLFPALAVALAVITVAVAVLDRVQLSLYRGDLAAAATYTSNWWYIFHHRSYFVAAGRPPLLQHLWSLAVEEQFYLLWPVIILALIVVTRRGFGRRIVLFGVAAGLMTASAVVMGIGSATAHVPETGDPSRWYFGTDSHAVPLLAGAALAAYRGGDGLGSRSQIPPGRAGRTSTAIGFGALAVIIVALSQVGEFSTWLYRVGFLGFGLLSAVMIWVVVQRGPLARALGWAPLVAVGRRSYAMYLWHWPVAAMTRPGVDLAWPAWSVFVFRVVVTAGLTEASYRLVEQPIRRLGWKRYWRRLTGWNKRPLRGAAVPALAALTASALVFVTFWPNPPSRAATRHQRHYAAGITYVQCSRDRDGDQHLPRSAPQGARCANTTGNSGKRAEKRPGPPDQKNPSTPTGQHGSPSAKQHDGGSSKKPSDKPDATAASALHHRHLVVYGDSVPLGAIPQLSGIFGSVTNHAAEGMQASDSLSQMTQDGQAGKLSGTVVLLHTGDNGVIPPDQLQQALKAAANARRVVVATPHVPKSWQDHNVTIVQNTVPEFSNAAVLDWDHDMDNGSHTGWVYPDGIHLTPPGRVAYEHLVAEKAQ